ncbi:MAG TPA: inositol monophosphatase [Phycisphaerae bacterium]|nr:inositol monophosphatase [Phycisphaerae bacterium]
MSELPRGAKYFVEKLRALGGEVRAAVMRARERGAEMAGAMRDTAADTIYGIDAEIEPLLVDFFERLSRKVPVVLIAEGLHDEAGREGERRFGGSGEAVRIIVDPIDGTRGLMYDKRSAWFLAGVAVDRGEGTRLSDIEAAVQVEIPLSKQWLADTLWAVRGGGAHCVRENLYSLERKLESWPLTPRPSGAENISHGFATVADFFPGTKELAGRLAEEIVKACIGPADVTRATVFEDQYISTGGQLYELMMGHDRFVADVRPIFYAIQKRPAGLCVHPYDVASVLIAREAGVEITDGMGGELDGPLDTTTGLSWAGFANRALRARIEPVMTAALRRWLEGGAA